MNRNKSIITIVFLLLLAVFTPLQAQSLYRITLYRAAPAKLIELIDVLKNKVKEYEQKGGEQPFIVRHSQGDQWDFMVYENISNYSSYYSDSKTKYEIFTPPFGSEFYNLISFRESFYARGPKYSDVRNVFKENNFFHVELFVALAGKQEELLNQREMENIYLNEIGRKPNLIFTVEQGAEWDCFTLGGYRDIKHFAESADIPLEIEEKAAIKAGFKGVNDISPYLRSLIARHHDTLGGQVK